MLTSDQQNDLARAIQRAFPLERDPYARLGEPLGVGAEEVRAQLLSWERDELLREVSGILEGSALGHQSALVACCVPAEQLERVALIINEHPTITHNYVREHDYNLWFTIAVPDEMGIEASLERLGHAAGVPSFAILRRTLTFKIGVNFDLKTRRSVTEKTALESAASVELGDRARRLFRALQTPLRYVEDPFGELGERLGVDPDELLAFGREHLGGAMRRYVATYRHRRLGVSGNGMAVWDVPEADQPRVGGLLASAPEVSHCYAREAAPGFPYTVYSMIHGPDREAVEGIVARLAEQTGVEDRIVLFSTHEYKKCRLRYFLPELDAWWDANALPSAGALGEAPAPASPG